MNRLTNPVVSVDIPSGLPADGPRQGQAVEADFTLSIEVPKLAFFIPENQQYVGEWVTIPIGLDRKYLAQVETPWTVLNANDITPLLHQRHKFDHKGTYGHMLVIGGSFGKAGAAILCSQAALRSGAGLVTAHVPGRLVPILQTVNPEVMVDSDEDQFHFTGVDDAASFDAVAIGCGLGTDESTMEGFRDFLARVKYPPVIDADALNLLAAHRELLSSVPHFSILTPHLKEFERIFGPSANHFERLSLLQKSAQRCQVYIVLKGAHTAIATPEGNVYFNTTGNPGMATGGSGDVLTGIIASLLAQGYGPGDAAKTGVYLHGLAGDMAAEKTGYESLIASDIIANIGEAFLELHADTDFPSEISAIQSPYET
jgi:NAD(P)H-hydrate epimerase